MYLEYTSFFKQESSGARRYRDVIAAFINSLPAFIFGLCFRPLG